MKDPEPLRPSWSLGQGIVYYVLGNCCVFKGKTAIQAPKTDDLELQLNTVGPQLTDGSTYRLFKLQDFSGHKI